MLHLWYITLTYSQTVWLECKSRTHVTGHQPGEMDRETSQCMGFCSIVFSMTDHANSAAQVKLRTKEIKRPK